MARRGHEAEAEALDIVIGIVQGVDFELASIARAGIDLAYRQTAAEPATRSVTDGGRKFGHRGIVRRRRLFGEGPAKQAFKKQLAHLRRP